MGPISRAEVAVPKGSEDRPDGSTFAEATGRVFSLRRHSAKQAAAEYRALRTVARRPWPRRNESRRRVQPFFLAVVEIALVHRSPVLDRNGVAFLVDELECPLDDDECLGGLTGLNLESVR